MAVAATIERYVVMWHKTHTILKHHYNTTTVVIFFVMVNIPKKLNFQKNLSESENVMAVEVNKISQVKLEI